MTDEIMYALMQLSGQEYVDAYAADVKRASGADAVSFGSGSVGSSRAAAVRDLGDRRPDSRAS